MRDDCRTIGHFFLEYVYRELDEALRFRVDRHLEECPRCREELRELQATLDLIDRSTLEPNERLSENFTSIVMAIVRRRAADRNAPMVKALAAACFALVVTVSLLGGPKQRIEAVSAPLPRPDLQALAAGTEDPLVEEIVARQLAFSSGNITTEVLRRAQSS